jgi:hypothetical protein
MSQECQSITLEQLYLNTLAEGVADENVEYRPQVFFFLFPETRV